MSGDETGRDDGEAPAVEKWPLGRKLQLVSLAVLVMAIADALTSWWLISLGVDIELSFSVVSGIMSLFGTVPFLWAARPREPRHLYILCAGTFAAMAVALVVTALLTSRFPPGTINFMQHKLFILPALASFLVWVVVWLLSSAEAIWGNLNWGDPNEPWEED